MASKSGSPDLSGLRPDLWRAPSGGVYFVSASRMAFSAQVWLPGFAPAGRCIGLHGTCPMQLLYSTVEGPRGNSRREALLGCALGDGLESGQFFFEVTSTPAGAEGEENDQGERGEQHSSGDRDPDGEATGAGGVTG